MTEPFDFPFLGGGGVIGIEAIYFLKYLLARLQAKPKDFWKSHRYRAFWG